MHHLSNDFQLTIPQPTFLFFKKEMSSESRYNFKKLIMLKIPNPAPISSFIPFTPSLIYLHHSLKSRDQLSETRTNLLLMYFKLLLVFKVIGIRSAVIKILAEILRDIVIDAFGRGGLISRCLVLMRQLQNRF